MPSYKRWNTIDIATVVSISNVSANASSSLDEEFVEQLDLVLVGNDSISSTWLDAEVGFAVTADNKILYQTASWSVLEDGSYEDKLSSVWARFQATNSSASTLTVCAMVSEWNSTWKENKAALFAVDVMNRLDAKCGENDIIAVAFTAPVSELGAKYLEGEIAVNEAVAPFPMFDVDSVPIPEASDRLFVHLPQGLCPRDESAQKFDSHSDAGAPLMSLFRGEVCMSYGPKPLEPEDANNDSDWERDLRFIIPVGICVFLLGCGGLVYLLRQKKKDSTKAETETPKGDEKEDPSSLPYVLSVHPV
ncbi:Protocadherin alpha 4 unspliced [Phytophthora palmivora]|uniref:Protocadherin alpha 4 unspliced n=1 Tax=Phytophthora palmivora TaxID=4796 RepID=A0A2P4XSZ1_9STRA|nr:Protocadherin alpha 4 unspliced [Phytophthora palmivora]